MKRLSGHSRALGAILALGMLAGCTGQATSPPPQAASPPQQADVSTAPQLAGAWYQVYFDSNKYDINARGRMIADRVAYVVKNNPATRVTVIGRTDRAGTPAANMALSQHRAEQVRDALIAAGVPADRIDTSWTGEGKQAVATPDEIIERHNRVVDVTVVDESR
ncbi:MAG TPA: OmpA family protein [Alphaproteobacteria bacterium]|jgi:OOP family OmpA-OmpF porin|nr:OmpA family protein [Alphaproteobacteria bacterium]